MASFLLLAIVQTGLWSDLSTRFFVGPDPTDDVWVLNWVSGHLLTDPARTFEGNNFYPSHGAILFCEPLVGPAVLVLPLRLVTGNPVLLYNAALLLSLTLASWGFYRLGFALCGDVGAALLAGILIPYSPQQTVHFPHLNMVAISWFPFLLLSLLRLVERPGAGPAAVAAAMFALQACTSGYHALNGAILSLILAAWAWRRFLSPKVVAYAGVAALAALALVSGYVLEFVRLKEGEGLTRGVDAAVPYSADLVRGFFRSESFAWRRLLTAGGHPVFPGFVALGLSVAGLWRGNRYRSLLAGIAGVFFLLSLGPVLKVWGRPLMPLPTMVLYESVPVFDTVRHPVTFIVPATMGLGLLAVLGAHACGVSRRPLLLAGLLAASVAETLSPPVAREERPLALPEVYTYLQTQPPGALLELPVDDATTYRWWSTSHGLPIVNGQGAFEPKRYADLYRLVRKEWAVPSPEGVEEKPATGLLKRHFPIRYLVLHAGVEPAVRANLDANSRSFELLHETRDGERVYRVHRGGRGEAIRRRFREDQLAQGQLRLRLRGPAGAAAEVLLGEAVIGSFALTGSDQEATIAVPSAKIRRGLNEVTVRLAGGGREIVLTEIEAR